MAHLIDKDALVAWAEQNYLCENASMIRKVCYKQLLEHLNTLEVKEVDFEKKDLKKVEDKNPLLSDFFKAEYERGKADAQKLAEWSEEDEKMFRGVIAICDIWSTKTSFYPKENDDIEKLKNWLKSLRLQKQLKPSEEQIKTCKEVYADILSVKGFDLGTVNNELNRLEEQLKKLKG